MVLAATNHPWDIDDAFRRRFEKRVYIRLPDEESRENLLKLNLKDIDLHPEVYRLIIMLVANIKSSINIVLEGEYEDYTWGYHRNPLDNPLLCVPTSISSVGPTFTNY